MSQRARPPRIAIACQGGGSHTAFTAGVLERILEESGSRFEVVALSGTSGGAVCALFAWYGWAAKDPEKAHRLLEAFWEDNSARSLPEALFNEWAVQAARLPVEARVSPYSPGATWLRTQAAAQAELLAGAWHLLDLWGAGLPGAATAAPLLRELRSQVGFRPEFVDFERLLEEHVPGDRRPQPGIAPRLLVGAVDVLTGAFRAFDSGREPITPEKIRASAAIPTLFRAVPVDGSLYWDGLFSQNPPVKEFVKGVEPVDKPDQIWVVQINPRTRKAEPRSAAEILDRRNELAGNLSLEQELDAIKTLNRLLAGTEQELGQPVAEAQAPGLAPLKKYKTVRICRIVLDEAQLAGRELDYASKLDRRPTFLRELRKHGRRQAGAFLADWPDRAVYEV